MSKQQYESNIKNIYYSQNSVYQKLADLNNLAVLKERFNDPMVRQKMQEQVKADQIEKISQSIESMTFSTDSVSCNISPLGNVTLKIIDRDEPKCIKFETENSPLQINLWIQLLPTTDNSCRMKVTIGADLNPFIKAMVQTPLKEGVEKLADMLSMIPYGM